MSSWNEFESAQPALAAKVRECFAVRKHMTMATLRADGSPRISGTEVQFRDGELLIGSMLNALKARDLQRDPRIAIHGPTVDAPEDKPGDWLGDAKVAGIARELLGSEIPDGFPPDSHAFAIDLTEVSHVTVSADNSHLVVTAWNPASGLTVRERR